MNVTEKILYVGVNDTEIDLFEGQFTVPNGMAYNSYLIVDEQCAVVDSVDVRFATQWICNIKNALANCACQAPSYLVVHHMEMDHSGSIRAFVENFPNAKIVASKMAFSIIKNLFGDDFAEKQVVVGEGSKLELGAHCLNFVATPNVHWPEVVMSYESTEKVLFSADAFGKFGAIGTDEDWACEARRYYFGIVGKFGAFVQPVLKKLSNLELATICPLHGPVLKENLSYYINLYNVWSSYGVESTGIVIAYTSVYGNTKCAAELLAQKLRDKGVAKVVLADLARTDLAENVEDAFRYGTLVLATTTYCNDVFPAMKHFIAQLVERNYQKRTIAFVQNGSWNAKAANVMKALFEENASCVDLSFAKNVVTIKTALSEDAKTALDALADELVTTLRPVEIAD